MIAHLVGFTAYRYGVRVVLCGELLYFAEPAETFSSMHSFMTTVELLWSIWKLHHVDELDTCCL